MILNIYLLVLISFNLVQDIYFLNFSYQIYLFYFKMLKMAVGQEFPSILYRRYIQSVQRREDKS